MNLPRKRLFWAVAVGHMVNDIFMSMGAVILAFISISVLPLTNTQIGLTISATQLIGAVSQPGFGWWADRTGGRWLGAGGVVWTVGFMMLALVGAQTGYFWLLLIPFAFRALGSGAFHPVGAMHAANSDYTRTASNMAYFFLMGQLGLAIGPAFTGYLLDIANPNIHVHYVQPFAELYDGVVHSTGNMTLVYFLGVLAFPAFALMATSIPNTQNYIKQFKSDAKEDKEMPEANGQISVPIKPLLILGTMVGLRSLAHPGSVAFIPVLFQQKGWSPTEYGAITSSFWVASGFAGLFFGNLADRFDRRLIVAITLGLSAPALFILPLVDNVLAFVIAIAAGGLAGGSHSIIVVIAQELFPKSKALASGSILGFIFAMGALGSFLIGTVSDMIGLATTFQLVAGLIVAASVLALALPKGRNGTAQ